MKLRILNFLWRNLHIHKTVVLETEITGLGVFLFFVYTTYREYSACLLCGKGFVDNKIHVELLEEEE